MNIVWSLACVYLQCRHGNIATVVSTNNQIIQLINKLLLSLHASLNCVRLAYTPPLSFPKSALRGLKVNRKDKVALTLYHSVTPLCTATEFGVIFGDSGFSFKFTTAILEEDQKGEDEKYFLFGKVSRDRNFKSRSTKDSQVRSRSS